MVDDRFAGQTPYDTLRTYFLTAEERAIHHARPSHIASQIDEPLRTTLEALVEAIFHGDATLHWELECPHCHGLSNITNIFYLTPHDIVCPMCSGEFTAHADHEAQVTFSPHPTLRTLSPDAGDADYKAAIRRHFPPTMVHDLMTVQRFREWAQNEPLPPNEYLEVRQTTLWFSDLTGSTALYARNGDPFAYRLVREHFDLVTAAIHEAAGAVVKTIGDGVMAVFTTGDQAVRAALDANERLSHFNRDNDLGQSCRLRLKIGIHTGPAIVVTLNERLDYFGTTVNIASRVSNMAEGEEIILTADTFAAPAVQALVAPYELTPCATDVRGLDDAIPIYRLRQHGTQKKTLLEKLGIASRKRSGQKRS